MNEFDGKTVLMTGTSGFIGSSLLRKMKNSNAKLIIVSRHELEEKVRDNVLYLQCPLEKLTTKTWEKYGVKKIDYIFHLAAFTPKTSEESNNSEEIIKNNIVGTEALLKNLPSVPEKIIFASSIDVYSQLCSNILITEKFPLGPSGLYGASKIYCEQLVRIYSEKIGCKHVTLRFGHIFGPGEEKYEKLIPNIIKIILTGGQPVLFGDRKVERDFLYVDDAVDAIIRSAKVIFEEKIINIVRGVSVNIEDVISILIDMTKCGKKIKFIDNSSRNYSLRFDNKLMIDCLGDFCFVPLAEGLKREIEYSRGIYDKE